MPDSMLRASTAIVRAMDPSTPTLEPARHRYSVQRQNTVARLSFEQQTCALLNLPAELRNQVYEDVACSSGKKIVVIPGKVTALPIPFSQACNQIRQEFDPIYYSLSLAYATEIEVHNKNFDLQSLAQSLEGIPGPSVGVERAMTFVLHLTGTVQMADLEAFVKELAEPAVPPKTTATIKYRVDFDLDTFNLHTWRINFARLSKRYRFHHSDGEQRAFEKVYWAFVEEAEKVDGVSIKQYVMGCWRTKDGRMCFI